ncbi:MAG TPA: oxygenase MpaB family protein [Chitinophagaceae bacterium]|nr:oxygenase MpaB family protein [Chitinophagaceae bacterium]
MRQIWGKSDTVLFIFAGAAAEFALNRAVDWLYFTGKLPADPLGRLFSTVSYSKRILFARYGEALKIIDSISSIHRNIERARVQSIPAWAYRDVLFMLIHYSIASYETLERKLSEAEKEEVFDVFYRFGKRMHLEGLPDNYHKWLATRNEDLQHDLVKSEYTTDLYKQYKKHLGSFRYRVLIEGQIIVVPEQVKQLLHFRKFSFLNLFLPFYKLSRTLRLDSLVKSLILPPGYKQEIKAMDIV